VKRKVSARRGSTDSNSTSTTQERKPKRKRKDSSVSSVEGTPQEVKKERDTYVGQKKSKVGTEMIVICVVTKAVSCPCFDKLILN